MKKIFSLLLSLILILSCVVPASAVGTSDFDRYLDITTFCNNPRIFMDSGSSICSFSGLPARQYYLSDLIIYTSDPDLVCSTQAGTLSKYDLGNGYYRLYGTNSYSFREYVELTFTSSISCQIDIISCKVSTSAIFPTAITGGIYAEDYWSGVILRDIMENGTSPAVVTFPSVDFDNDTINTLSNVHSYFYPYNWEKFDYIDINFTVQNLYSINSLTVKSNNGYNFPFNVSILSTDNKDLFWESEYNNNLFDYGFSKSMCKYFISLRIDLTNCDRSGLNDDIPFILFDFLRSYNDKPVTITLDDIVGYVDSTNFSTTELFIYRFISIVRDGFTSLNSSIDNLIAGSHEQQNAANSFNDSISDQADELQDLTADLNSVTRPELSDVNISTDGLVDSSVVLLATNGLGSILGNDIILRVLLLALTFALAGFILYGKR